jgi:hypothetical protein
VSGYDQAKRSVEAIIASAGFAGQVVVEGVEGRRKHFFVRVRATATGARATMITSHGARSRSGKRMTCGPHDFLTLKRLVSPDRVVAQVESTGC